MANLNTSPATSIAVIVNYIGKYCSKEEKKLASYKELLKTVTPYANKLHTFSSIVTKFINKLIGERDQLAQEVYYLLLNLPLSQGSRQIIALDCRQEAEQSVAYEFNKGQIKQSGHSLYKKYRLRPVDTEDVTFLDFILHYNYNKYTRRPRARPRVISYFLHYKSNRSNPQYSDYCYIKLLLHHPWRECENIATIINEFGAPDYIATYKTCEQSHQHIPNYLYNKDLEDAREALDDINEFKGCEIDDIELYQSFEALATRTRNEHAIEIKDPNNLGNRELDRDYDWSTHRGTWPQLDKRTYQQEAQLQPLLSQPLLAATPSSLQSAQRVIYNAVVDHYKYILSVYSPPKPLRVNINSKAGTGKSYLITVLSNTLSELAATAGKPSPLVRATPTGVAAFGINGQTTYNLLKLPVQHPFKDLPPTSLIPLQQQFRNIHYLVLNKKSMIGHVYLSQINHQLRQIFPEHRGEYFSKLSILLVSNFCQLPPVGQTALYRELFNKVPELARAGRLAYEAINQTAVLDQVMRQGGDDAKNAAFRSTLAELHNDTIGKST